MTIDEALPVHFGLYVGLDWAAEIHAVCVLDLPGKELAAFTIEPSAEGIASLIRRLARRGDHADVQVGIERPKTATAAAPLGEQRLASFLSRQGYSGRRPAAQLLSLLRSAPAGTADEAPTIAVHDAVLAFVTFITALNTATKQLDKSVAARLGEHPDAKIFTSLPRSGQINAAQVLAEGATSKRPTTAPTPSPPSPESPRNPGNANTPCGQTIPTPSASLPAPGSA